MTSVFKRIFPPSPPAGPYWPIEKKKKGKRKSVFKTTEYETATTGIIPQVADREHDRKPTFNRQRTFQPKKEKKTKRRKKNGTHIPRVLIMINHFLMITPLLDVKSSLGHRGHGSEDRGRRGGSGEGHQTTSRGGGDDGGSKSLGDGGGGSERHGGDKLRVSWCAVCSVT